MGSVLVGGAFVVIVFAAAMVALAVLRVTRFAYRTGRRANRAVSDARLRAAALPGRPHRDVARLRLRLRENMEHSRTVLASPVLGAAGARSGRFWIDAGEELHRAALALDARLALIEREPDPPVRARIVATLAPRVEQLIADTVILREAAYALTIELEPSDLDSRRRDLRDRLQGLLLAARELARA